MARSTPERRIMQDMAPIDALGSLTRTGGSAGRCAPGAGPPIYIWTRTAIDWSAERAWLTHASPRLGPKLALWNETFNMPFHTFRERVSRIAELNLSKVQGARCAAWPEIPEGALVLPVDDDDWFAPHVATVLKEETVRSAAGYHWISSFIEVPVTLRHAAGLLQRRIWPRTSPPWICTTNNYAMIKGPGAQELLANHLRASRWFEGDGRGVIRRIEQRLSVMNRTLGSQTTLGVLPTFSLSRSDLLRKFRHYRRLYEKPLPAELDWCGPYVELMAELMEELEVRT